MDIRETLLRFKMGEMDLEEAVRNIRLADLEKLGMDVLFDLGRKDRRDVPEIVLAEGKRPDTLLEIVSEVAKRSGCAVVSRLATDQLSALLAGLGGTNLKVEVNEIGKVAVVSTRDFQREKLQCKVGIVTAGTADVPVAEEASIIVEVMGCQVVKAYDRGVAGLKRAIDAAILMKREDVDVALVIAGMEGALGSVMASLLDVPVIGVPSSIGYGAGGKGEAALLSMLQACPLGLAVVNIDNGVNAAVVASMIGRRVALARTL